MLVPETLMTGDRLISSRMPVRRERLLPTPGAILVSQGDYVDPADVVAETEIAGSIRVLDAAKTLQVEPEKVSEYLRVNIGESVSEGQVLAERGRLLWRRSLVSPTSGTLTLLDQRGYLLIRDSPKREQIQAMMRGQITHVMAGRGVVIEGSGALLQGIWGNKKENFGLLQVLVNQPDKSISSNKIDAGQRGAIVVAGATVDREGLELARAVQVRGLIVGGIDASLLALANDMPYPIMLTEGFGHYPIGKSFFKLLKQMNGRDAVLSAHHLVRHGRTRPELFIPRTGATKPLKQTGSLAPEDRVRILSEPYLGQIGIVSANHSVRHQLPNKLNVIVCEVTLQGGEKIFVPYSNLERLLE